MISIERLILIQSLLASKDVLKFLRKKKISYSVLLMLLHLKQSKGLTMTELATHASTSTAAISNQIDRLENDLNFVARVPYESDKRKTIVILTPSGEELLREYCECLEQIFSKISEQDL